MNLQLVYRYILSLSKIENVLRKKTKTKGPKKKKKKKGKAYIVKFHLKHFFSLEILPVDAV